MTAPISVQNNTGFTLIEVLVAMVIMMVGLLGLLQSVNIAIEQNVRNKQRDEVVRVGESVMNDMRSKAFGTSTDTTELVESKLSNKRDDMKYRVSRTITAITANTEQYRVNVKYRFKNITTNHSIVSLRGR